METIFLMRHGETAWNQEKRVMGRLEIPLNRKGIAQGKRIARLLPDLEIRAIYTSPLRRALETARILAKECHKSVKINPNLTEVAFGRWQGYRFDDLIKDETYHRFLRSPLRAAVPGGRDHRRRTEEGVEGNPASHSRVPEGPTSLCLPWGCYPGYPLSLLKAAPARVSPTQDR